MAEQEACKHEGQSGTFCGVCGKQIGADPEVAGAIRRTLTQLLKEEYGMEPKKKPAGTPTESNLADKIFGAKKKKEEK